MSAAFGMEYLHSKDIVHFDLKCDNLLVDLNDPARPKCKVVNIASVNQCLSYEVALDDFPGTLKHELSHTGFMHIDYYFSGH